MPSSLAADTERLAVTPRDACFLLSIGNTRLYYLIKTGELESYVDGHSRRIPMAAIRKFIERRSAATSGRRGRGRPPGSKNKVPLTAVVEQTEATT
jgi:excisionase family DNA binding protein